MRILVTGGSGDLGVLLARELEEDGDIPVRMDVRLPKNEQRGQVIMGSILDRPLLAEAICDCEMVVHIAAWHGFHLVAEQKGIYDFWDLNVTGTFNVFEEAAKQGIKKFIYISSTSVEDRYGIYGHTKVLGEEIARTYHERHNMDVVVLRPSAFIPYWNKNVYSSFVEWAQWYWKGAVHISDVLQSVEKSIQKLKNLSIPNMPTLFVDGKYEYTQMDLQSWNFGQPDSIFQKYYKDYTALAGQYGLDASLKPTVFDIESTREFLSYEPTYSFLNLLQDLAEFGPEGPPEPDY